MKNTRILIFIVAYNHEHFIESVLERVPRELAKYDTEILIIDDASQDRTFETAMRYPDEHELPFKITVLVNPKNQRYGGNQKIGFHYAIQNSFDILALVHGDGQYAPEALPDLLAPIINDEADLVMGSRMATRFGALKGGMPLYKYVGNKILTAYQNFMLGTNLYEFHTGYRLYAVKALKKVPFDLVTNEFHFDNEMFLQIHFSGQRAIEIGIDTHYGDETCNVEGFRYAWDIFKMTAAARLQQTTLFYRKKFDLKPERSTDQDLYESKLSFPSAHSFSIAAILPGSKVLNVGCSGSHVARALKEKDCSVVGVDFAPEPEDSPFEKYYRITPDLRELRVGDLVQFDFVLILDMLSRFENPDLVIENLATQARRHPNLRFLATNGNILFVVNRLVALFGGFNYSRRGNLDLSARRLFTVSSFVRLFDDYGFEVTGIKGIPAPAPLLFGDNVISRAIVVINQFLIKLSKGLFAYQTMVEAKPRPSLEWLLERTQTATRERELNAKKTS